MLNLEIERNILHEFLQLLLSGIMCINTNGKAQGTARDSCELSRAVHLFVCDCSRFRLNFEGLRVAEITHSYLPT